LPELNRKLLNWLQLKAEEGPTFAQMLGHSFFNSLGIAFSFTAINVLLIDRHGIEILPYIYLIGGVLVLSIGRLYAYLEARLPSVQLFSGVLVFCILWTVVTRGLADLGDSILFLGILYCLYLAIYQLINLEFWGAAALIYDVRQSKRLFGLLSTGESVAKMGGYLLTPFIVGFFSLSDLLFFAAASFGISLFFLFQLSRINNDALRVEHHHHHHEQGDHLLKRIKKWIPSSSLSYLQLTSYFALFSAMVYYLVHYSFLNRVESSFEDVEQLAFFFGLFFGLGKFINLFIKAFLYSRFFNTLKIGYLVLVFPFLIALVSLMGFFGQFFAEDSLFLFLIVFGLIMLMDEILRTSVYLPSFFVLFQPLQKHQRLEGHTLAKAYMEPIGMGIAGLLMVGMVALNIFSLSTVILFLSAAALLWLFFGWLATFKYEEIVQHLLKNRLLTGGNLIFSVNESGLLKKGDLLPDNPVSQLYKLKLVGKEIESSERFAIINGLFKSNDDLFIYELLDQVRELDHDEFLPEIFTLIGHPNEGISRRATFVYCYFTHDDALNKIEEIIHTAGPIKKEFLIAAVLKFSGIYGATRFGKYIMDLLESPKSNDRLSAARIIGMTEREDYYHPLLKLLQDDVKEVRKQALIASAKVKNIRLIEPVLQLYINFDLSRFSAFALEEIGPASAELIKKKLEEVQSKKTKVRLIRLLGRIQSEESLNTLLSFLNHWDFELRTTALDASFRLMTASNKSAWTSKVNKLFQLEYTLFENISRLDYVANDLVRDALLDEFKNLKSRMLKLIGILYRKSIIQKAIDNLRFDSNHIKGNVLEMLENELRLTHSRKLTKVLEFSQDELFKNNGKNQLELAQFTSLLLTKNYIRVSEWTLAVLLRCCKTQGHVFSQEQLDFLKSIDSDVILQELNK